MLDKTIHSHLDEMDILEEKFKAEIDQLIDGIDRDLMFANPQAAMIEVVEAIKKLMIERYMPLAGKQGFHLADKIEKKDVVIDGSKDPKENEGIVNDNGNSKE